MQRRTRTSSQPVRDDSGPAVTEPPVTAGRTDGANSAASRLYKAAKTFCGLFLLLLLLLFIALSVWFLSPFLTTYMTVTAAPQKPAELGPVSDTNSLTPELKQALERWLAERIKEHDVIKLLDQRRSSDCGRPVADKMPDFALESLGAHVVRHRSSKTHSSPSNCVTLFGVPLWQRSVNPRVVIQGHPVLSGRCWPFPGAQGTLFISLSHPVRITHVTLDHLPHYNSPTGSIDSAPKDFEIYGTVGEKEDGTLLGTFIYNKDGDPTQTFELPKPSEVLHRFVELRVLTNWGHPEYTCVYRFRVHGTTTST